MQTGEFKRSARLSFNSITAAEAAMNLHASMIQGVSVPVCVCVCICVCVLCLSVSCVYNSSCLVIYIYVSDICMIRSIRACTPKHTQTQKSITHTNTHPHTNARSARARTHTQLNPTIHTCMPQKLTRVTYAVTYTAMNESIPHR